MKLAFTSILILVALILTACTSCVQMAQSEPPTEVEVKAEVKAGSTSTSTLTSTLTSTSTPSATATSTPRATATPVPPTSAPRPTTTPTATSTPRATATPEPPAVSLTTNANLRAGPGTQYPVVGAGETGQVLAVSGQYRGWYEVRLPAKQVAWVSGQVASANPAAAKIGESAVIPPTPTAVPVPTADVRPPVASAPAVPTANGRDLPAYQDVVVLGPATHYPVRGRVVKGWGYELVDASAQYDWLIKRDVFGQVAHAYWGNAGLYGKHPQGIRITLLDYRPKPECQTYCAAQAPVATNNRGKDDYSLPLTFGDGVSSSIGIGCAGKAMQYDPQECFIAVRANGPYLTDIVVGSTIVAQNGVLTTAQYSTPIFTQAPFTPLLGQARRAGDQWRWNDPFLEVVQVQ